MGPRAASPSLKPPVVLWSLVVSDCLCARAAAPIDAAAAERRDLCAPPFIIERIVIMNYESAGVDRSSLSHSPVSILHT